MNDFKGTTTNEDKMFKAIQKSIGAQENGWIGTQTMSDIAIKVGANCWPVTLKMYNMPVIISEDIVVANPKSGCKNFTNSLSGSFSYQSKPCSILINKNNVLCSSACHAFLNKPETVLYRENSGKFGVKKCKSSSELPANLRWAVGGMGLLGMYNPNEEGFTGVYADVLRTTNHTVLGMKNNMCYLLYCKNMSGSQINTFCKDKMKFEMAILLDGGHVAAINGTETFAKINTSQVQYSLIQAV